jgi:hypothetical protein
LRCLAGGHQIKEHAHQRLENECNDRDINVRDKRPSRAFEARIDKNIPIIIPMSPPKEENTTASG